MITFRQKEFWIGPAIMAGSAVLGLKQGADASAAQEEANEKAAREQRRHNKAMEEAAKKVGAIEAEKSFAALPMSVMRGMAKMRSAGRAIGNTQVGGLAQDFLGTQKDNIKKAIGTGASFAALGYAGDRLATSIKDHRENNDEGNKSFLKKAALGAATVGAGVLAAKRGYLGGTAQNLINSDKVAKAAGSLKKTLNPIVRDEAGNIKKGSTLGKVGMNAAFLSIPTVSYLTKKKSEEDMVDNTQKEFAAIPMSIMRGIVKAKQGFQAAKNSTLVKKPGQAISSGVSHAGSFISFYGKGGTNAVQKTGQSLLEKGLSRDAKNGGKSLSTKIGEWVTKKDANGNLVNAGKANLAAAAGTIGIGGLAMKAGDSIVSKPMRVLDKDAYKMEDQENGKI